MSNGLPLKEDSQEVVLLGETSLLSLIRLNPLDFRAIQYTALFVWLVRGNISLRPLCIVELAFSQPQTGASTWVTVFSGVGTMTSHFPLRLLLCQVWADLSIYFSWRFKSKTLTSKGIFGNLV